MFILRLARHYLCSPSELLARFNSHELTEQLAYDQLEPLPDSYWQAGVIASTMANLWGSGTRYKIQDFMPKPVKKKPQTQAEMKAVLMGFRHRYG